MLSGEAVNANLMLTGARTHNHRTRGELTITSPMQFAVMKEQKLKRRYPI
jgi:hypothetical protein